MRIAGTDAGHTVVVGRLEHGRDDANTLLGVAEFEQLLNDVTGKFLPAQGQDSAGNDDTEQALTIQRKGAQWPIQRPAWPSDEKINGLGGLRGKYSNKRDQSCHLEARSIGDDASVAGLSRSRSKGVVLYQW